MNRLSNQSLVQVSPDVQRPSYDRSTLKTGIVHLGVGAFHRAHKAYYTEAVLNRFGGNWGILGASLRSATVGDQLTPQDGLYTLVERSTDEERFQIIGAVQAVLVGPDNPAALIDAMANPEVKIVSLTVTEKGYCHDPATGNLNLEHPDIIHDLQHLNAPRTAIGYLVAALARRQQADIKSFTALSCDNLPDNGTTLGKVVQQFARKVNSDLAQWIENNTLFPCTMVDRIVPATTPEDRDQVASRLGLRDEGAVVAEPFTQWVIEDRFVDGRPEWEAVGAELVTSVTDYENMKLRLLNGSHSTLAYAGYLAGFDYISEVMEEPAFDNLITLFMAREAGETLVVPKGFDLTRYQNQLRERFRNTALKHRTWQIAMDGSQKLPQRLLHTVRDQLRGNGHIDIICLAVAAWIRYVSGVDERGDAIEVSDPLASRLRALCDANKGDVAGMVKAIVAVTEVFGTDLTDETRFVDTTTVWLERFYEHGVLNTVRKYFG